MSDNANKHPRTAPLLSQQHAGDGSSACGSGSENLGQRLANAEAALEQAGIGCWEWQIGTERVAWTPVTEQLWGLERGSFRGTLDEVAAPIFDEDLALWQKSVNRAIEEGVEHRIEMRLKLSDGSLRWIEAIGNVIRDEHGTPIKMMGTAMDVTERKTAELSLRDSEAANSAFLQAIPDFIFRLDRKGAHKDYFVPEGEQPFVSPDKILGNTIAELLPTDVAELYLESIDSCLENRTTSVFEYTLDFNEENRRDFEARMVPYGNNEVLVLVRNVSAHKLAERERELLHEQLAQAQKMESIGGLAGGVAHDFNNLLQAILGNAELLQLKLPRDSALRNHVEQILSTGQRSVELTRQLLAFARKQTVSPVYADLNMLVQRTLRMLKRLIGENITVHWRPHASQLPVYVDTAQLDQVIANVVLNARDAIGDTGSITVSSTTFEIDPEHDSAHPELDKGSYARLTISDDGGGMDEAVLEKAFEPFYTTKKTGEGTGLGLAMVYGAVKQNKGEVSITSTKGQGTSVVISLPLQENIPAQEIAGSAQEKLEESNGDAHILVVEDEYAILGVIKDTLEHKGYQVYTASTPSEALKLWNKHKAQIDLVLTDVIMPEMNGEELIAQLRETRHDLKYIFMSGYPADVIAAKGLLNSGINFIHKPFNTKALTEIVRHCLCHQGAP